MHHVKEREDMERTRVMYDMKDDVSFREDMHHVKEWEDMERTWVILHANDKG